MHNLFFPGNYDILIKTMTDCLRNTGTKSQKHTVDMMIATLQKLSLKYDYTPIQ